MEGPTVPRDSREAQSAEGVSLERGAVAPLHYRVCGLCVRKIVKNQL